ncbi:Serine/threonine-protein kinase StkP [Aquisphaera giovannonii]|uniref:Serine/threonine-protein kinase StkP n=1 Tax=Aquisphaera giovannonii TaxID=406548 RepID=A0A5B9W0P4_9BACT|nr:protein kinase [Aquisphaera giovannonii]QEH34138.1 Serine/threonine-protein kinase StkP [Aquisphaera giovannonii]
MPIQREYLRTVREACAELRSRLRDGEAIRVEAILSAYPTLGENEEAVLELIHTEVTTRHDLGQKPTLDEWQERFPDLLGRMESLLSLREVLGSEMPTLSDGSGPAPAPAAQAERGADDRFPRIANYHIIEEIGRGGMGVVYKARQSNLSRVVALKMILAGENAGLRERARLRNEAEAAAQLIHPNVVQIFEIGDHDGLPYLTMEYVVGGNLTRMIRGMPQAFRWSARLTEILARAIHVAHQRGIVHRDLNPSNILMTPDGVPKITDFGLAKFLMGEQGVSLNGVLLGTPSYMAPEQVSGGEGAIGPATDVYALGALLYEMVTGAAPFRGFTPMETLCQVVEAELVPPSRLRHGVPADLETICLKCLDREPSRRYASAADLADDLRRFGENQPIRAKRTTRLRRFLQWRRRQPLAAGLLAFSLLLSLLLLGGAVFHYLKVTESNRELEKRLSLAESEKSVVSYQRSRADGETRGVAKRSYDMLLGRVKQALDEGQPELAVQLLDGWVADDRLDLAKGFEWEYIRSLIRRARPPQKGHSGAVICVAASGRPGELVSGDASGHIIRWDTRAGTHARFRDRHAGKVLRLAYDAPSNATEGTVASLGEAAEGLQVRFWDAKQGRAVGDFRIGAMEVSDFRLSHGGTRLHLCGKMAGGDGWRAWAWVRSDGGWRADPSGARGGVTRLAWSGGEDLLAEGSSDGTVQLFRADGSPARPLEQRPAGAIQSLTVSKTGRRVAAGTDGGALLIWDAASGKLLAFSPGRYGPIRFLRFWRGDEAVVGCDGGSRLWTRLVDRPEELCILPVEGRSSFRWFALAPDERRLAAGDDRMVWTWGLADGVPGRPYRANSRLSAPIAFDADGSSLLLGCGDHSIRVWDHRDLGEEGTELGSHDGEAWSLCFDHGGAMLASGGDDHLVRIWDLKGRREIARLAGHDQTVTALSMAPRGEKPGDGPPALLASAGLDGKIFLWDLDPTRPEPAGSPARRTLLHDFGAADRLWAVSFSPHGTHLAAAGKRGVISMWDLRKPSAPPVELPAVGAAINALAYTPSGNILASSSTNGLVKFWDPDHFIPYKGRDRTGPVTWCLAFTPDGQTLVEGTADRTARFWSIQEWGVNQTILGHPMGVRGVATHPDQSLMATGCDDGKVRLWDLESSQLFYAMNGHTARVNAVAFSPDGSRLASCDHRGSVRIWSGDAPPR